MFSGNYMKAIIKNGKNAALIFTLVLSTVLMFSSKTFGQHRGRGIEWRSNVPRLEMVSPIHPMRNYARIQVSGRNYFYRDGTFYRK